MTPPLAAQLSPTARELIRGTLERVLDDAPALFAELHDAVAASAPAGLVADPALALEIERSNVAVLAAWLEANIRWPGEPVEPVLSADTLNIVRDVARRGLEDSTYNYFRVGLAVASQHIMHAAFALSTDPVVLREALATMLSSSADYIDRSISALREVIEQEREARSTGGRTRRLEVATALLEGEGADTALASSRLGFELGRPLLGSILWADPRTGPGVDGLERAARALAEACGARTPLVIPASAASVWAWLPTAQPPDAQTLRAQLSPVGEVRMAIGSTGMGVSGFRRGHLDAMQTQRVMHRLGHAVDLATHDEVRVVALAGSDEPAAGEFVAVVLGALATAAPELRSTLRSVVSSGFDTVTVAESLGLHRNTVLARVRRAENLLPPGWERRWIDIALALELDRWLGGGATLRSSAS
ncbi:MAG: helix-turn-helix domain-containing protein [Solirubrobacteraceae bacterium]|nr:helix-turn-helix domain-containing protein [Solirubrobacteraceae bacterium]